MKKLFTVFALLFIAFDVMAADTWKMTGVMAVYPGGPLNNPFSAPIVNDSAYKSEADCDAAIGKITQSHPQVAAINNGHLLPADKAASGYVAVAATCLKHSE